VSSPRPNHQCPGIKLNHHIAVLSGGDSLLVKSQNLKIWKASSLALIFASCSSHVLQLEDDFRRRFTRFKEEYLKHNLAIVEGIKAIAVKKNATAAQLCIAWVSALGDHVIPLPGSS
jgi:aryl-alcohol dehydrogenase-like predicted oxidoreductase